jgi:hypothetical protein
MEVTDTVATPSSGHLIGLSMAACGPKSLEYHR